MSKQKNIPVAEGHYDVVVIGSGFGGAAAACRLAQAGRSVAILEKGRHYDAAPMGKPKRDARRGEVRYGHFELKLFPGNMNIIQGVGVGGGSLHYFNVRLRTKPEVFRNGRWPAQVNRGVLDPYYDLVNDMLEAEPLNQGPQTHALPLRGEKFLAAAAACAQCSGTPYWVDLAVYKGAQPKPTLKPGVSLTKCVYCGDCLAGCPPTATPERGAANARPLLDFNYLELARQNGAEVFAEHKVRYLRRARSGGWRVTFKAAGRPTAQAVIGTQVVLAAGTLGSTELLLRSKRRGFLRKASDMLGKHYSGNGDFVLPMTADTPDDLQPKSAPTIVTAADFSTGSHRILVEDLGALPLVGSLLGLVQGKVTEPQKHAMRYLCMGNDSSDGRLFLGPFGLLHLHWPGANNKALYKAYKTGLKQMSQELGGRYVPPPLYDELRGTDMFTAHPLGGCTMGADNTAATGVVDHTGRVLGYEGLYVADGSIVPSALVVNPSLTISALGERVAFWMLNRRDMTANDAKRPVNS